VWCDGPNDLGSSCGHERSCGQRGVDQSSQGATLPLPAGAFQYGSNPSKHQPLRLPVEGRFVLTAGWVAANPCQPPVEASLKQGTRYVACPAARKQDHATRIERCPTRYA
jgi:hypothetical protein